MQLKDVLGTPWKLKLEQDILTEEDLESLPSSIKNDILEKEVIHKIELEGFTYYELPKASVQSEKPFFKETSSSTAYDNPPEVTQRKKKNILLAIFGNMLILLLKLVMYVVSFIILIFSVLLGVMGGIISLLCGIAVTIIGIGTLILLFVPNPDFDKATLLLIVIPLTPFVLGVILGEQLPVMMSNGCSWLNFQACMIPWFKWK